MTNASDDATLSLLRDTGQTVSSDDEDIRGRVVKDNSDNDIGKVEDLVIDQVQGKVRLLLVEHGGFLGIGREKSFIPVDDVTQITERTVHINHSKDHVATGPGYDPELMSDKPYLDSVYCHYGIAPYWGADYANPGYPYYPAMRPGGSDHR